MLTKIVPIGNSRGIRIPKAMLEHCGFGEEVDLQAKNGALILRPFSAPRAGWAEAFGGHIQWIRWAEALYVIPITKFSHKQ